MAYSVHQMGVVPLQPAGGKGGEDVFGPYEPVLGWPKPVQEGMTFSRAAAVCAESADRVIVASHFGLVPEPSRNISWGRNLYYAEDGPFGSPRAKIRSPGATHTHHIVVFDRTGEPTESWTWNDGLFGKLDRIIVNPYDADRSLWGTDGLNRRVYQFSRDGKSLLLEITPEMVPDSEELSWMGHDLAWLPNGEFYTSGRDRIDRFTREGEHVWSLAARGDGPGEFSDIHGLVVDVPGDRIYVADRANMRIQVFDLDWTFVDEWPHILGIYSMHLTRDGYIWVGDGVTQKFLKYDRDGRLVTSWGTFGAAPGCLFGPHGFDVDDEGSLYIAENYNDRVQKLTIRDDVDRSDPRIIGPLAG
jgi:hypothetical protein